MINVLTEEEISIHMKHPYDPRDVMMLEEHFRPVTMTGTGTPFKNILTDDLLWSGYLAGIMRLGTDKSPGDALQDFHPGVVILIAEIVAHLPLSLNHNCV